MTKRKKDGQAAPAGKKASQAAPAGKKARQAASAGKKARQAAPAGKKVRQAAPAGKKVRQAASAGRKVRQAASAGKKARQAVPAGKKVRQAAPAGKKVRQAAPAGRKVGQAAPAGAQRQPDKGRRFTSQQQAEALRLIASGVKRVEIARVLGSSTESLRRWHNARAARDAKMVARTASPPAPIEPAPAPPAAPMPPAPGLAPVEVDAILELKKAHPSMGPAQIRVQLKRFRGWRLSIKAIAAVLVGHGYKLVRKQARPEGDEEPRRFEAPRRNALWQLDFAELRVGDERVFLLVVVDDYSRFVVGSALASAPSSEVAVETIKAAIARHGKCEAVYTDRGGAFLAWRDRTGFQRYLEQELIEHHVSGPYRPQGRGKVEALIGTVQRELWQVRQFESVPEARAATQAWIEHYNERRAHMGLDGLCPADRFFGRADAVSAQMAARVRGREMAAAAHDRRGGPVEEAGAVEVLRLMLVDGQLELRVFGARVKLGATGI